MEGPSAGGIAKQGRDAYAQAILPLKGKILNVEKARIDKMLSHDEIGHIIRALGCGIGKEEFDITKRRYDRLIIMTDADVDGSHIRTLVLTFLFRHMRPLIETGRVFIAQPPLYLIKKGKREEYILNDREFNGKLSELGLKDTVLIVRELTGGSQRTLTSEELGELMAVLDGIDHHGRVMARRGVSFQEIVCHQRDEQGRLPTILAEIHSRDDSIPKHKFFHNDAELSVYKEELVAGCERVDVIEARHLHVAQGQNGPGGNGNGEADDLSECYIVRHELSECRMLEELILKLGRLGLSIDDFFLVREELVTGELPPAKYLLRQGDREPVELGNLADVLGGIRKLGAEGLSIKRFKGLGEMNADELWETTMDRQRRTLLRVTIADDPDDAEHSAIAFQEADRMFHVLMGDSVEERRRFIEENAINAKNLDI